MDYIKYIYPNQKIATLHKAPADQKHTYGIFNKDALFSACRNLTGNELKTYLYVVSNQPEYCMVLSPKDIAKQVGSTENGIRSAIQGLTKKGFMVQSIGNKHDFFEAPPALSGASSSSVSPLENDSHSPEKTAPPTTKSISSHHKIGGEIIQRDYMKNTIDYKSYDSDSSFSYEWKQQFQRIKVGLFPHTMGQLKDAVGKTPDVNVIRRLISQNWSSFEKGMDQKEGYRLKTLINLSSAQYSKWEHILKAEEKQREFDEKQQKEYPKIDFSKISRASAPDGLDDISALLDEVFNCDDAG